MGNLNNIEFIDLFAHLAELEVQIYLPSFPHCNTETTGTLSGLTTGEIVHVRCVEIVQRGVCDYYNAGISLFTQ